MCSCLYIVLWDSLICEGAEIVQHSLGSLRRWQREGARAARDHNNERGAPAVALPRVRACVRDVVHVTQASVRPDPETLAILAEAAQVSFSPFAAVSAAAASAAAAAALLLLCVSVFL
jgi:hypothetical protein